LEFLNFKNKNDCINFLQKLGINFFVELDKEDKFDENFDPSIRIKIYENMNFVKINFDYIQLPLHSESLPVEMYLFRHKHGSKDYKTSLSIFLCELWSDLDVNLVKTDLFLNMQKNLNSNKSKL
jgi:hypothetical protein